MEYVIRNCELKDLADLVTLCAKHAAYEKSEYCEAEKESKLRQALFSDNAPLHCWLVVVDNNIAGYATYTFDFSTWNAGYFLHLDCLYLEEHVRGAAIGKEIINNLICEAKKRDCVNIQWQTPVFNERAIRFYRRMGARSTAKQRFTLSLQD